MKLKRTHYGPHMPRFTVKAMKPTGRQAPDFVDRGLTGDSKPGECKETGCYGKFFMRGGKPHMQICSRGEVGRVFPVANAADARRKVLASCQRQRGNRDQRSRQPSRVERGSIAPGGGMAGAVAGLRRLLKLKRFRFRRHSRR